MHSSSRILQSNRARHQRLLSAGFTLTEIALALAIFSFALVSMLGLLSVGMKNSRKANIQLAASNLLSGIASDVQSSVYVTSGSSTTATCAFTSPRLDIKATVNTSTRTVKNVTISGGSSATLDESGTVLTQNSISLMKQFKATFIPAATGTPALCVTLEWPPNRPPASSPEGSLNAIIPLPLP